MRWLCHSPKTSDPLRSHPSGKALLLEDSRNVDMPMNPIELLLETCAEWLIELIHLHNWTVMLVPIFGLGVFLAGLFVGKSKT